MRTKAEKKRKRKQNGRRRGLECDERGLGTSGL